MVNELRARELVRSPEHHQCVLRAPANPKHPRVLPAMPYSAISTVARALATASLAAAAATTRTSASHHNRWMRTSPSSP